MGAKWVIGTSYKGAFVTMVEHKTSQLVSSAIVSNLKPFSISVKTLTYDNGKEFAEGIA